MRNLNYGNLHGQSSRKNSQNNFYKNNRAKLEEWNNIKNPYLLTNFNSIKLMGKSSSSYKSKIHNNSNSIKVNKKINHGKGKKDKNKIKMNNNKKCSLTSKINSIKNNFHIGNKDIFILDDKNEINYISNHNTNRNSTRSQKYINNRSLGDSVNNSGKKEISRNKKQYTSLIDKISISRNNSIHVDIQLNKIQNNSNNKDLNKNENSSKRKNNHTLFNHKFIFLKKNKNIFYNDDDKNYKSKRQSISKNKNKNIGLEKNCKYSSEYSLSRDYSNIESNKEINKRNRSIRINLKINKSSNISKGIL